MKFDMWPINTELDQYCVVCQLNKMIVDHYESEDLIVTNSNCQHCGLKATAEVKKANVPFYPKTLNDAKNINQIKH